MNKRRTKPLIPPLSSRWARTYLTALLTAVVTVGAQAQTQGDDGFVAPVPRDRNSELRTGTWSIYAEGGLSWATDVWYQNLDAKKSYKVAPAVGGGVDYTIRPWVRVGAEYLWSRYRREQRFSQLDTKTMTVKAYGNYLMNFHNARLGVGFNLMELWPNRRTQWLNIWAGTGVGCTFAKGNEYGIYFSNTMTQGGKTLPFIDGESVSNDGSITITGSVRTSNRHESFKKLYVPASLHIEADVSRQLSLGLKGEIDWLMNSKAIAPKNYAFALVTLRYNFVASRAKVQRARYGPPERLATQSRRSQGTGRRGRERTPTGRAEERRPPASLARLRDCQTCRHRSRAVLALRAVRPQQLLYEQCRGRPTESLRPKRAWQKAIPHCRGQHARQRGLQRADLRASPPPCGGSPRP